VTVRIKVSQYEVIFVLSVESIGYVYVMDR